MEEIFQADRLGGRRGHGSLCGWSVAGEEGVGGVQVTSDLVSTRSFLVFIMLSEESEW